MKEQPPQRIKRTGIKELSRITIQPLMPEHWGALEDLFGEKGACNGCWCMYWRIGGIYTRRSRELNRKDFQKIIRTGPPPGLLAFDGDLAVGWCQITPRTGLPYLEKLVKERSSAQRSVWSISCFYIRNHYRRMGITGLLIEEALKYSERNGADLVEAYPVDPLTSRSMSFTGYKTTFERAGFRLTSEKIFTRSVMRSELK